MSTKLFHVVQRYSGTNHAKLILGRNEFTISDTRRMLFLTEMRGLNLIANVIKVK